MRPSLRTRVIALIACLAVSAVLVPVSELRRGPLTTLAAIAVFAAVVIWADTSLRPHWSADTDASLRAAAIEGLLISGHLPRPWLAGPRKPVYQQCVLSFSAAGVQLVEPLLGERTFAWDEVQHVVTTPRGILPYLTVELGDHQRISVLVRKGEPVHAALEVIPESLRDVRAQPAALRAAVIAVAGLSSLLALLGTASVVVHV